MEKNSYLSVTKIKKSIELGNGDSIEKIIIRVKTERPEMLEINIFDNLLEKVDFEIVQTGVEDESFVRESDNLKGYTEVNYTPTYTFEITGLAPEYPDDELNLYCSFDNADIEVVEKEEVEEKEEIVLDKKFVKNIDGDEYEMNLKVIKTKNGLEGFLKSNPKGVDLDAYGKSDIVAYFSDYLPEELKEKLKDF